MKNIAIFGCSGSIGKQTIEIIRNNRDKFNIVVATNNENYEFLKNLQKEFNIEHIYCESKDNKFDVFSKDYVDNCFYANKDIYKNVDIVINGISGISGLVPSYYTLKYAKVLATANKESFVCAGILLDKIAKENNCKIYPLDSEHSAIWQCLESSKSIKKIIITASGGAFRDNTIEEISNKKAIEALNHPNWVMGKKVTIDCATLVNKGFELIEAKRMFNFDNIEAICHRQSYIHALVEYVDNTISAIISNPSMLLPISYALNYPNRVENDVKSIDFNNITSLDFSTIDENKFPCFSICKELFKYGNDYDCTILVAADDYATKMYLEDRIKFYDINKIIKKALKYFVNKGYSSKNIDSIYDILKIYKEVLNYLKI